MVDWPSTVPYKPRDDTWSIMFPKPIRTEMEGGNLRSRSRAGDNYAVIRQEIPMETEDQWDDFWEWYWVNRNTRFNMQVYLGSGYSTKSVMFEEDPQAAYRQAYTGVSMTIRVFNAKPV